MLRFGVPAVVGLIIFAVWLYCIFDVIATDELRIRNLPKILWLLIVFLLPTIGSVAWLALGRPLYASLAPGSPHPRPVRPVSGPEDTTSWGSSMSSRERELERRERELERRERALEPPEPTEDDDA